MKPLESIHYVTVVGPMVVSGVNIGDHINPQGLRSQEVPEILHGNRSQNSLRTNMEYKVVYMYSVRWCIHSIFVREESRVVRTKVCTKKGREQKQMGKKHNHFSNFISNPSTTAASWLAVHAFSLLGYPIL